MRISLREAFVRLYFTGIAGQAFSWSRTSTRCADMTLPSGLKLRVTNRGPEVGFSNRLALFADCKIPVETGGPAKADLVSDESASWHWRRIVSKRAQGRQQLIVGVDQSCGA